MSCLYMDKESSRTRDIAKMAFLILRVCMHTIYTRRCDTFVESSIHETNINHLWQW